MLYRCVYTYTRTHTLTHTETSLQGPNRPLGSLWVLHITALKYERSCTRFIISAPSLRTMCLRTKPLQLQGATGQIHSKCKQVPNNQKEVASASYQLWLWFFCSAGSPVSFTCRKFSKKSVPISKLKWESVNAEYCYQTTVQHLYCREFQTSQELETA